MQILLSQRPVEPADILPDPIDRLTGQDENNTKTQIQNQFGAELGENAAIFDDQRANPSAASDKHAENDQIVFIHSLPNLWRKKRKCGGHRSKNRSRARRSPKRQEDDKGKSKQGGVDEDNPELQNISYCSREDCSAAGDQVEQKEAGEMEQAVVDIKINEIGDGIKSPSQSQQNEEELGAMLNQIICTYQLDNVKGGLQIGDVDSDEPQPPWLSKKINRKAVEAFRPSICGSMVNSTGLAKFLEENSKNSQLEKWSVRPLSSYTDGSKARSRLSRATTKMNKRSQKEAMKEEQELDEQHEQDKRALPYVYEFRLKRTVEKKERREEERGARQSSNADGSKLGNRSRSPAKSNDKSSAYPETRGLAMVSYKQSRPNATSRREKSQERDQARKWKSGGASETALNVKSKAVVTIQETIRNRPNQTHRTLPTQAQQVRRVVSARPQNFGLNSTQKAGSISSASGIATSKASKQSIFGRTSMNFGKKPPAQDNSISMPKASDYNELNKGTKSKGSPQAKGTGTRAITSARNVQHARISPQMANETGLLSKSGTLHQAKASAKLNPKEPTPKSIQVQKARLNEPSQKSQRPNKLSAVSLQISSKQGSKSITSPKIISPQQAQLGRKPYVSLAELYQNKDSSVSVPALMNNDNMHRGNGPAPAVTDEGISSTRLPQSMAEKSATSAGGPKMMNSRYYRTYQEKARPPQQQRKSKEEKSKPLPRAGPAYSNQGLLRPSVPILETIEKSQFLGPGQPLTGKALNEDLHKELELSQASLMIREHMSQFEQQNINKSVPIQSFSQIKQQQHLGQTRGESLGQGSDKPNLVDDSVQPLQEHSTEKPEGGKNSRTSVFLKRNNKIQLIARKQQIQENYGNRLNQRYKKGTSGASATGTNSSVNQQAIHLAVEQNKQLYSQAVKRSPEKIKKLDETIQHQNQVISADYFKSNQSYLDHLKSQKFTEQFYVDELKKGIKVQTAGANSGIKNNAGFQSLSDKRYRQDQSNQIEAREPQAIKSLSPASRKTPSIAKAVINTVPNARRASDNQSAASDSRPCRILASSDTPDLVKKTRLKLQNRRLVRPRESAYTNSTKPYFNSAYQNARSSGTGPQMKEIIGKGSPMNKNARTASQSKGSPAATLKRLIQNQSQKEQEFRSNNLYTENIGNADDLVELKKQASLNSLTGAPIYPKSQSIAQIISLRRPGTGRGAKPSYVHSPQQQFNQYITINYNQPQILNNNVYSMSSASQTRQGRGPDVRQATSPDQTLIFSDIGRRQTQQTNTNQFDQILTSQNSYTLKHVLAEGDPYQARNNLRIGPNKNEVLDYIEESKNYVDGIRINQQLKREERDRQRNKEYPSVNNIAFGQMKRVYTTTSQQGKPKLGSYAFNSGTLHDTTVQSSAVNKSRFTQKKMPRTRLSTAKLGPPSHKTLAVDASYAKVLRGSVENLHPQEEHQVSINIRVEPGSGARRPAAALNDRNEEEQDQPADQKVAERTPRVEPELSPIPHPSEQQPMFSAGSPYQDVNYH